MNLMKVKMNNHKVNLNSKEYKLLIKIKMSSKIAFWMSAY